METVERRKLEMVDRCRSLKPTWWLTAVIFVALSSLMSSVEAGAWRDDFEGEDFRGWAIRNPHSVWTVQDGFVHVEVRARGLVGTADFLEFTAFPGPYERFTVTFINPSAPRQKFVTSWMLCLNQIVA